MAITLSSANPDQVSSFSSIQVDLVDPSRQMHIFSGIAIPAFRTDDDGDPSSVTCLVDMGVALPDAQQGVAQVGLASIVNDESAFTYAVDGATVEIEGETGRIVLHAELTVRGDGSGLERFGFQVVVVSGVRSIGVTGRVVWDRSLFDATNAPEAQWRALFAVTASTMSPVDTSHGGFGGTRLTPLRSTGPQSLHPSGNDFWTPYALEQLPLETQMSIDVDHLAGVFPDGATAVQIAGPHSITLRPGHLTEAGVDFRIVRSNVR